MSDNRFENFLSDVADSLKDEIDQLIEQRLYTYNAETKQRVRELLRDRLATDPGKEVKP